MSFRVLHVLWDGKLGGVQRYVERVAGAEHWTEWEHGVCLMTHGGVVISNAGFSGPVWELGLQNGLQLRRARGLQSIDREWNPHVIHCHCDTPAFSLQLPSFRHRRLVYTEHGDTLVRSKRQWVTRLLWNHLGSHWQTLILNSVYTQENFLKKFPALASKCHVIPNPLLESGPPTIPTDGSTGFNVGFFGRLDYNKGLDRLLDAAPTILKHVPQAEFHVYGNGPIEKALRRRCRELDIEARCVFHGFTADALAEMARCRLVAVPSRIEAFGLVALEAQSVGRPVVSFDGHGVQEIVVHNQTGFIIPQDDDEGFALAVVRLLTDAEEAERLGRAGQQRAGRLYSLKAHVQRLEAVYALEEDTGRRSP